MAYRDVYKPMIEEILRDSGRVGSTSSEIIESIGQRIPASVWGIRAALNRLFKRGLVAKTFVYEPTEQSPFGKRVYRYYLPEFRPRGTDVLFAGESGS